MQISAEIMRGFTEVVLLANLAGGDSYGYAITKDVSQLSQGACEIKEGTLYAAFHRMEQAGLIRAYWGEETRGGRRRYFAITEEGRKRLQEERARWEDTKTVLDLLLKGNRKETEQGGTAYE